jgi:hypothetical protein
MKPGDIVLHQWHDFFDDQSHSYYTLILAKKDFRFIIFNLKWQAVECVYSNELFDII